MPDVAVYAVPNNGGWYDFGFFVGIMFFGVGARKGRTVYVTRRSRDDRRSSSPSPRSASSPAPR